MWQPPFTSHHRTFQSSLGAENLLYNGESANTEGVDISEMECSKRVWNMFGQIACMQRVLRHIGELAGDRAQSIMAPGSFTLFQTNLFSLLVPFLKSQSPYVNLACVIHEFLQRLCEGVVIHFPNWTVPEANWRQLPGAIHKGTPGGRYLVHSLYVLIPSYSKYYRRYQVHFYSLFNQKQPSSTGVDLRHFDSLHINLYIVHEVDK
jgi:hypothetical protein